MILSHSESIDRNCPVPWRFGAWSALGLVILCLSCVTVHTPTSAVAQSEKEPASKSGEKPKTSDGKSPKKKDSKKKSDKKPGKKSDSADKDDAKVTEKPAKGNADNKEDEDDSEELPRFSADQIAKAKAKYVSAEEAWGVGVAHYNSRNFAASREPFEAALILAPDREYRLKVCDALRASYRLLGTTEPFVQVTEYAIRHSSHSATKSVTRGSLLSFLHERGKLDDYIKRHETQLKEKPDDWLSTYMLSEVYSRLRENPKRSVELLKKLAELDGEQPADVINVIESAKLATQYVRAKEYQKGAELFEKLAGMDEGMAAWHWKEAAQAWLKVKENDKALAAAKKSLEAPGEKRSDILTHFWHRHLGDIFLAVGEPKLAIPQFEKAIASTKIEGYIKDCNGSLAEARKKAGE